MRSAGGFFSYTMVDVKSDFERRNLRCSSTNIARITPAIGRRSIRSAIRKFMSIVVKFISIVGEIMSIVVNGMSICVLTKWGMRWFLPRIGAKKYIFMQEYDFWSENLFIIYCVGKNKNVNLRLFQKPN